MISVGGSSYNNGINFSANNYSAYFETKGDITKISLRKNGSQQKITILHYIGALPFIRGLLIVHDKFTLTIIFLFLILELIAKSIFEKNPDTELGVNIPSLIILIIIGAMLIILFFVARYVIKNILTNIKSTWQYHGAEHKVLMTNDQNNSINLENCRKSSRICDRCGTMLISIFIFVLTIVIIVAIIFRIYPIITSFFLIAQSISYELFLLKQDTPVISLIFKLGYFLQERAFTLEPDDFKLKQAIETFKILEAAETGKIGTEELEELLKNGKTIFNKDIIANNY